MHIRFLDAARARDVAVDVASPDATIADLSAAIDPHRPVGPLLVDGRSVGAATPLDRAGIGDGAVVSRPADRATPASATDRPAAPAADSCPATSTEPVLTLAVTTGFDAGRELRLAPGAHRLGRAYGPHPHPGPACDDRPSCPVDHVLALDDPTVSATHARLVVGSDAAVTVTDLGSTNGTQVDGRAITGASRVSPGSLIQCGAARLVVGPAERAGSVADPARAPSPGARTRPWHRPPRAEPATPAEPLDLPPPPDPPPTITPVGLLAVVASVTVGAVMVAVLGSWTYALFALLGPVLMVANAVDSRRRRRRSRRRGDRHRRADLARLEADLVVRRDGEQADRARRYAGPLAAARVAIGALTQCWERRPGDPDAFDVRIGMGTVPWEPPIQGAGTSLADDVAAVVDRHRVLTDAPVGLRLEPGGPVGVVGPVLARLALSRGIILQAVTAHGPADLQVAVLARPDRAATWDWTAWLPHARHPEVDSLLAGHQVHAEAVAAALLARPLTSAVPAATPGSTLGPLRLVVVDDPSALEARRSAARSVLRAAADPRHRLVPLVLVDSVHEVPAACRVILVVDDAGRLCAPPHLASGPAVLVGSSEELATDVARSLARYDDPELDDPGRHLPGSVALVSLLGEDRTTPAALTARWRAAGRDPAPRAVIGVAADGPMVVDLAADGPHALVAGTTGSGKSELLRTLVVSLAAGCSPDHLTFVLIDFKGGSAFDACARLPHCTGLVTDLADLRRRGPGEPLPRLVVVVDEFATLAAELGGFVDALVGVAQRGRSLGVHLVLATQRPSGSISEAIRANTALRVALRVQSAADSTDVLDVADAATIPRRRPGRALVRLGPGEVVAVQTALSTATSTVGAAAADRRAIRIRPLCIDTGATEPAPGADTSAPSKVIDLLSGPPGPATDLERLVDAMAVAWSTTGGTSPRRPWTEPLPHSVPWPIADDGFGPQGDPRGGPSDPGTLVLGLGDDPDRQRRVPFVWRLADGPLLAVGLPGSGTTTVTATAVLEAARRWDADHCHVHVIDLGAGDLTALAGLPHVGAVIGADDLERHRRLVTDLAADLASRRAERISGRAADPQCPTAMAAGQLTRLLVVDGIGAFRARWDDLEPSATWSHLVDVATRGAEVGIHVLLAAEGLAAAPHQVVAACRQRLVFRLGERSDHSEFGIAAAAVPDLPPGRAVSAEGSMVVQVARPADGVAAAVAHLAGVAAAPGPGGGPRPVGVLPTRVVLEDLMTGNDPASRSQGSTGVQSSPSAIPDDASSGRLALLLGVSDVDLAPARLVLPPGGHALVTGPPRSGRSTALATMAEAALRGGAAVVVVARPGHQWPAAPGALLDPDDPTLAAALERPGPLLVVVDDADLTDDDHVVLRRLVTARRADRHVVAAGRSDRLRGLYAHWSREVRADRCGLLLAPDPDLDGELVGARLPRRSPVMPAVGRGWLAGGEPEGFVQVALPSPTTPAFPLTG